MLENIIKNTDLTDKEAAIYLATLKLGKAKVSQISKLANINRATSYPIILKLIQKNYLIESISASIQHYEAIAPTVIYERLKEKTTNFKQVLSELKKIQQTSRNPFIKYYEGLEGVKEIYKDSLKSNTEILSYANSQEIRNFWPTYDQDYVAERVKRKIFLRGFAIDDLTGRKVKQQNRQFFRKIKLLPKDTFKATNEINIYSQKVAYTSLHPKPMGFIIDDQGYSDTQKSIFEILWKMIK